MNVAFAKRENVSFAKNNELIHGVCEVGRGLNFGRPSFATPSVDRDVKPLVQSLNVLSEDLKEPTHLSIGVG